MGVYRESTISIMPMYVMSLCISIIFVQNPDGQTQPLESPPPFQDYSSHNPAPGNTNGISPMNTVRPTAQSRHFLGGILPSSFLPRQPSVNANGRVIGAGNSGIFTNLSARPTTGPGEQRQDGPEYAPEDEQKDGPPVSSHSLVIWV